jgi:hypothetical protein
MWIRRTKAQDIFDRHMPRSLAATLAAVFFLLPIVHARAARAEDQRMSLWQQGTKEYRDAQYDRAMATYLKLTQYKNPDGTPYFREVGLYLGTLHARKGQLRQACDDWSNADLRLPPHDSESPQQLAMRINIDGVSNSPVVRKCAQVLVTYMQESPDSDSSMVAADGMVELLRKQGKTAEEQLVEAEAKIFRQAAVAAAEESDFTAQMLARAEVYRRLDRKEYADQCEGKIEDLEDSKEPPPD